MADDKMDKARKREVKRWRNVGATKHTVRAIKSGLKGVKRGPKPKK